MATIDEGTPVINAIGNKTVSEGSCLTFTATATAAHGGALAFTLDPGAPSGASITGGGQFTWCPTEAQAPGLYSITVRVTEAGAPTTTDAETFQVTAAEVNLPPVLAAISNKTIMAGNTLSFTATATDPDLPAQGLFFSLDPGAPAGATITAGGLFSWPVPINQVAGTMITVRVTDQGGLSDTKSFFVTVLINENGPPVVNNPGDMTVNEGSCLNFTATATSAGGGTLTFSLGAGAPAGASITAAGQFSWCPTEAQGPGSYPITVNCTEGTQTASATFTATVREVNLAPVLNPIGNKAGTLGVPVTFTATATDADLPANSLTFSLDPGAPAGATINPTTGAFSWTVSSCGSTPVTIRVTDDGSLPLSDAETILIATGCGTGVVLNPISDKTANEGVNLQFAATATTSDGSGAFFFLSGTVPLGASITSAGWFMWTPTERQGGGVYPVTICAQAGGDTDCETFNITVIENNLPPFLSAIGDKSASVGVPLSFTALATDADIPANTLTFSLDPGAPPGATITAGGSFTWTPATVGTFTITVHVIDNGSPPLSDSETFTVSVGRNCRPPTASAGGPYSGSIGVPITFDGSGSSDPDGDVLTYAWDFGDGVNGSGITTMHVYSDRGTYSVHLQVTDACDLTDDDATTATIAECASALAFTTGGNGKINLGSGKPTACVQIEPTNGAFAIEDVDLSSIVMRSTGTGTVDEIHAQGSKTSLSSDRNNDGIDEIAACFVKSDLQQLFSGLTGTVQAGVTLEGDLAGGGRFCTSISLTIKAAGGGNLAATISPNPLNPSAVLTFTTHERGPVLVQLFDVRGRLVRTLRDEGDAAAGYHDVRIDGTDSNGTRLSSGVYYVRIRAGAEEERKAITILK